MSERSRRGSGRGSGGPDAVIAVDPGRDKCGVALVKADGTVVMKAIMTREETPLRVRTLACTHGVNTVVLGDRTSSRSLAREIRGAFGEAGADDAAGGVVVDLVFIDEHESSMEGRKRYLRANPPRGLGRLVPVSMRTPAEPFDDYVAVILAERFFHSVE